jgi:hypothetical protein
VPFDGVLSVTSLAEETRVRNATPIARSKDFASLQFFDIGQCSIEIRYQRMRGKFSIRLVRHLENEFQQYRGAKPQAGDSDHEPAGIFVRSEDVLQQLRSAVGDLRLVDIS